MKKSKKTLSVLLTVCLLLVLLPTASLAQADGFTGDIYVYNGYYTCWNSESADFDVADSSLTWIPVNSEHPIDSEGEKINRNMYILDGTELYFGDLDLGTGSVYSHGTFVSGETEVTHYYDLGFEGGALEASGIDAYGDVWIEAGVSIFVDNDFTSAYEIYSYGCTLDVGGNIQAPYVYFDSDDGPVFVTVEGDIIAYDYDQEGGSVTVAGNITVEYFPTVYYPAEENWSDEYTFELVDHYSDYNFVDLNVGGSVTADDYIYIGYGEYYGYTNEYDEAPVVLHVAGDLEAENEILIAEGNIDVDGAVRTTSQATSRTIYLYGGRITAGEIDSATDVVIGDFPDSYGLNDTLEIDVNGDISAAYEVEIYGGNVTAGGAIQTASVLEGSSIDIFGGNVSADSVSSVTYVQIGSDRDDYGMNDTILVYAADGIEAADSLYLYGGDTFAGSVSCASGFTVYDGAALFDAVSGEGSPDPLNNDSEQLYRTSLSGLIPNGMAVITVNYGEGEGSYTKTFTALADENGQTIVWLPAEYTGAAAAYAETTALLTSGPDMVFSAPEGVKTAGIGISVPDAVFDVDGGLGPWGEVNYFSPVLWTFTGTEGLVSGFPTGTSEYDYEVYRDGELYNLPGVFIEGDYVISVTTQQTIGEDVYLAAGTAVFTIEPLVVTVKANNKTADVGGALPGFTVSISDNGDGVYANYLTEDCSRLFYAECYGTTAAAGSFPLYARADCEVYFSSDTYDEPVEASSSNHYFTDYAECLSGCLVWIYSVRYDLVNGVFSVADTADTDNYYTVTVKAGEGGSVSPSTVTLMENSDKKFTITPDEGYEISKVLVDGVSVGAVAEYAFTNLTKDHTLEAKFVSEEEGHVSPSLRFSDVDTSLWYHEGIDYVLNAGLFNGVTSNTFEPNTPMTRAMLVTVLYRLDNNPDISFADLFKDIESGKWYTDAVLWAAGKGIVTGYDDGTFAPDDCITREQLAVMLYRYAQYKGYDVSAGEDTNILSYDDASDISEYAIAAMQWACGAGIIQGRTENTLAPLGTATRAEVATILMRFIQNFAE